MLWMPENLMHIWKWKLSVRALKSWDSFLRGMVTTEEESTSLCLSLSPNVVQNKQDVSLSWPISPMTLWISFVATLDFYDWCFHYIMQPQFHRYIFHIQNSSCDASAYEGTHPSWYPIGSPPTTPSLCRSGFSNLGRPLISKWRPYEKWQHMTLIFRKHPTTFLHKKPSSFKSRKMGLATPFSMATPRVIYYWTIPVRIFVSHAACLYIFWCFCTQSKHQ